MEKQYKYINEEVVFEGTHEQLIELIKKNNHENNKKNH